jgi:hypothetical protein
VVGARDYAGRDRGPLLVPVLPHAPADGPRAAGAARSRAFPGDCLMSLIRSCVVVLLAVVTIACGDTVINLPTNPSATTNATTTPTVVHHTIVFRVLGNTTSARVRYSTPLDGLGQVVTSLPYFNSLSTTGDSMFLSLEATPISYGFGILYPFLSVQIVVDNTVFREATTQDFTLAPLAVSGQWRQ